MAKVIWTDPAIADLARIRDRIARETQSYDRAVQFCLELLAASYDRLGRFPDSGAPVEALRDFGARELYKHGYRIIYVHIDDGCYITQCIHSSRELERHIDPDRWSRFF